MVPAASEPPPWVAKVCVISSATSRGPREMSAGFHQIASDPAPAATTACPIPSARAPVGRRKSGAPSGARPVCAPTDRCVATSSIDRARRRNTLKRRRLVDEHDRNAVAHLVSQLTGVTEQRRFGLAILELAFALGANQDGEKLLG